MIDTVTKNITVTDQFKRDVIEGLNSKIKKIPSKYFYDANGDKLFQEIMNLDEYYLTKCELEILQNQSEKIIKTITHDSFDIIELGAGDGEKIQFFINSCLENNRTIRYIPIDISKDVLVTNKNKIKNNFPSVSVQPQHGEYFSSLKKIEKNTSNRVLMFMGSNIGNFQKKEAIEFVKKLYDYMHPDDYLILGVDLKKNPKTILAAYDDSEGITKKFNLNLLNRINTELNADFQLKNFDHYASYNPITGITYSFLISLKQQTVTIDNKVIKFNKNEAIHTEVSLKYSEDDLKTIGMEIGIRLEKLYFDHRHYYSLALYKK